MTRISRRKQLQDLEEQLRSLRTEVYTSDAQNTDRLTSLESAVGGHDARAASLAEHEASLADLHTTIATQGVTIDEQRATITTLTDQLGKLDSRTTADTARVETRLGEITQQVLRQVEELSNEVDNASRLAQQASESTGLPGGLLDDLKSAQTKLATEQVRYDLALRAELAELADRLRRPSRG